MHEQAREERSHQRRQREIDEVDDAGCGAAMFRPVRFLDDRVGDHCGARGDACKKSEAVGRERVRLAEQDEGERTEQYDGTADDDGLPAADAIGERAQERATDDPAKRHRGGAQNREGIVDAVAFLQEAHAPHHVEDGRRKEQQCGDQSAEERLRIEKHAAKRGGGIPHPAGLRRSLLLVRLYEEKQRAGEHETQERHRAPEAIPGQAGRDGGSDQKLSRRSAGHPEHLRRADQGGGARGWKIRGNDVDGADQREDATGALQKAAKISEPGLSRREQERTERNKHRRQRNDAARAELIDCDAGDEAEDRIAVIEHADQRGDPRGGKSVCHRKLGHHHRGRRAQHVLIEVEEGAEEPGQRYRADQAVCDFAVAAQECLSRERARQLARPPTSPCISNSSPSPSGPSP